MNSFTLMKRLALIAVFIPYLTNATVKSQYNYDCIGCFGNFAYNYYCKTGNWYTGECYTSSASSLTCSKEFSSADQCLIDLALNGGIYSLANVGDQVKLYKNSTAAGLTF